MCDDKANLLATNKKNAKKTTPKLKRPFYVNTLSPRGLSEEKQP